MTKLRYLMYKCMIRLNIPLFSKEEMRRIKDALDEIEKEKNKDVAN